MLIVDQGRLSTRCCLSHRREADVRGLRLAAIPATMLRVNVGRDAVRR
jgi:hypothetical protein